MIKSMTGYGKGQGEAPGVAITVEIRSVNHRYGDISIKLPRALLASENDIKKRVADRLKRGKIDVFVNQDTRGGAALLPAINRPLAEAYLSMFSELAKYYPVEGSVPLALLVSQKDVVTVREGEIPEADLRVALDAALVQALDMLEGMRRVEGEATLRDFEQRLVCIDELLRQLEERAVLVPLEWQGKLKERLARLAPEVEADPQRLAQELVLFADRCDISEELVRFRSHLQQFRGLLVNGEPVGRQLDFLLQELNREVNTMGSKSNDGDLTRQVVSLKSELEKVREQVQNVE